jgi:hypothetical protein
MPRAATWPRTQLARDYHVGVNADHAARRLAHGQRGGFLPWALLVAGSVASLAANVAVAESTLIRRVIAAWLSFTLTASYELLTRQVRHNSTRASTAGEKTAASGTCGSVDQTHA